MQHVCLCIQRHGCINHATVISNHTSDEEQQCWLQWKGSHCKGQELFLLQPGSGFAEQKWRHWQVQVCTFLFVFTWAPETLVYTVYTATKSICGILSLGTLSNYPKSVYLRDGTYFEKSKLTLRQWIVLVYKPSDWSSSGGWGTREKCSASVQKHL